MVLCNCKVWNTLQGASQVHALVQQQTSASRHSTRAWQASQAEGSGKGRESSGAEGSTTEVQALFNELRRWVDGKNEDASQARLVARVESLRGRPAVAIK